jgi:hypothetical protein
VHFENEFLLKFHDILKQGEVKVFCRLAGNFTFYTIMLKYLAMFSVNKKLVSLLASDEND